ncbi:MAG: deoxyribodipyrimidine photo-lyase [Bacteroidota bacterium]
MEVNIFWFRRDLRLKDNAGLFHALQAGLPVVPIFIFDTEILDKLEDKADRRVEFIHATLEEMQEQLLEKGSTLHVLHGTPAECFAKLVKKYSIRNVFANHDYEPYAMERDGAIKKMLGTKDSGFKTYKDQVIFEKLEIAKNDGKPYTVFTPYSRKWKATLTDEALKPFPSARKLDQCLQQAEIKIPTLASLGFTAVEKPFPSRSLDESLVEKYAQTRDFPGVKGTSKLGVHLRFGTISIRDLVARAMELSGTYLNELIWREFYQMILFNFPEVGKGKSFKPAYDKIEWRRDAGEFEKWCEGKTGYPIVDAGMREINATGFMHNRVRMIVASFLCKHLLLDWRLGEAYFAEKLLDYDLASNNGGWQWAAGSGCDAAPYFRIFNPYLQTKKFDPKLTYITKWVPEFQEFDYPPPIVIHEEARKRCLEVYSKALKK